VAESASLSFLSEAGIAALPFVHERDGLQAIVENKIDAFVHNELVLKYLLRTEFPARVQVLPETFDHYYVSMGMPSGSPLREPLNRALLEIMSRDDWLRLLESYVGSGH
jgi:ABC-type amino acid transport substrate-binding protein